MTHPPPDPEGRQKHMHMNTDPEWLRQMAEREDGGIVSVGGWVHDLEALPAWLHAPPFDRDGWHYCMPFARAGVSYYWRRRIDGPEVYEEVSREAVLAGQVDSFAARLDAALAGDPREAVERAWELVRELRGDRK